jgi:hypothetical protein
MNETPCHALQRTRPSRSTAIRNGRPGEVGEGLCPTEILRDFLASGIFIA